MRVTRRDLLKLGTVTGGAAMLPVDDLLPPSPRTTPFIVELLPGSVETRYKRTGQE